MVTEHSATPKMTRGTVLTVRHCGVSKTCKTGRQVKIHLLISVLAIAGKVGVLARDVRPAKTPMLMQTSMPILSL